MMLGSLNLLQSISGSNTNSVRLPSTILKLSSLSTTNLIGLLQWAQDVLISTSRNLFCKCPCTKGVAIASSAQAASKRSPVLKTSRCPVASVVTGNAQETSSLSARTRKNRFLSRSSTIVEVRDREIPSAREMASNEIDLPSRGSSRTTKFRTK